MAFCADQTRKQRSGAIQVDLKVVRFVLNLCYLYVFVNLKISCPFGCVPESLLFVQVCGVGPRNTGHVASSLGFIVTWTSVSVYSLAPCGLNGRRGLRFQVFNQGGCSFAICPTWPGTRGRGGAGHCTGTRGPNGTQNLNLKKQLAPV